MIGCLVVLMEEDFMPSSDIAHGHEALGAALLFTNPQRRTTAWLLLLSRP
jgi:hypothetical protein